jgi:hypothetical protein
VYGALTVLFVILGHRLGLGAAGYGYLLAGMGAGGVLATGLSNHAANRAYGLALPAYLAGIAAGALLAPLSIALFGVSGTLVVTGAGVIGYDMLVLARPAQPQSAPPTLAAAE